MLTGAALARVQGIQRNPSIFREGFANLSLLKIIQCKEDILALLLPKFR